MSKSASISPKLVGQTLLALAIGTLGGAVFWKIGTPLPWMLGSLFGCLIASLMSLPVAGPTRIRAPMSAVIGVMMGAGFSPELATHIVTWWLPIAGLLLFLITAGSTSYLYLRLVARFDAPTAFFSGVPGGLVEMVTIGDEAGADMRHVVLVHAIRIVVTVFSVPLLVQVLSDGSINRSAGEGLSLFETGIPDLTWFAVTLAAGIVLAQFLKLPARQLLGPMAVSALVHGTGWLDFDIPSEVLVVAQIVIGTSVGCRFAGTKLHEMAHVIAAALVSSLWLILLAGLFAWAVAGLSGHSIPELLLAYSPGGLAEMGILAIALQLEVAMVSTHHAIRILLVVIGASILARKTFPSPIQ